MATLSEDVVKKIHEFPCELSYTALQYVMKDIILAELDMIAGRSEQFSYVFDKQELRFGKSSFSGFENDKRFVLIWQSNKVRSINEIYALVDDSKGQSLLEMHLRNNFTKFFEWLPMPY